MNQLETFDMYGEESINSVNHNNHHNGDPCHRCGSINTHCGGDCTSQIWWSYLKCDDCKLCCIYTGGSEE